MDPSDQQVELARTIVNAQQKKTTVAPPTQQQPELTTQQAFEVQQALVEELRGQGQRILGFKMAKTNWVTGSITDPSFFGHLFSSNVLGEGERLDIDLPNQPQIEPEVAVRLGQSLHGPGVTASDVARAMECLIPAIEIVNTRIEGDLSLQDAICDNALAYRFVLGPSQIDVEDLDLRLLGVLLERNGEVQESGASGAIMGHPFNAVAELANLCTRHGLGDVPAGSVILTGGITPQVSPEPGDVITARFDRLGSVTVRCGNIS